MTITHQHKKLKDIPVRFETNPLYSQRDPKNWIVKVENFFHQHREKLIWVHVCMFVFFIALITIPIFLPMPMYGATPLNNFTEFSQFMIWGLWFPLVFASVLFTGRSWCGVLCPMGAASEWANRVGLKRPIPAWLKWQGTPILSFLLVTILGQTVDVRDEASAMAEIFGGTFILALMIGFLFGRGDKKRAWCRHVCPIGSMLGVFSRMGMVQFANKQLHPGNDKYTEKGICPTMIAINQKKESRHCIECFRCVNPKSKGGLFIRLRHLGEEIEKIREHNPNLSEVFFIFLGTGISLGGFLWLILPLYQTIRQNLGTWFLNHNWNWIGNIGPSWLMSVHPEQNQTYLWLDFMMITEFMILTMLLTAGALTMLNGLSTYLANKYGGTGSFKQKFSELGYQFAPVAMMSIIIGLGDKLFQTFSVSLFAAHIVSTVKGILLLSSLMWSMKLGYGILKSQHVKKSKRFYALLPGAMGSLFVALAWWPAVFGL